MANKIENTLTALRGSLVDVTAKKGAQLIGKWMDDLEAADFRGAKTIHEDLGRLQRHLEGDDLDGAQIAELLTKIGESTQRAANHEEGKTLDQVHQIGEALVQAAQSLTGKGKSSGKSDDGAKGKSDNGAHDKSANGAHGKSEAKSDSKAASKSGDKSSSKSDSKTASSKK